MWSCTDKSISQFSCNFVAFNKCIRNSKLTFIELSSVASGLSMSLALIKYKKKVSDNIPLNLLISA